MMLMSNVILMSKSNNCPNIDIYNSRGLRVAVLNHLSFSNHLIYMGVVLQPKSIFLAQCILVDANIISAAETHDEMTLARKTHSP